MMAGGQVGEGTPSLIAVDGFLGDAENFTLSDFRARSGWRLVGCADGRIGR